MLHRLSKAGNIGASDQQGASSVGITKLGKCEKNERAAGIAYVEKSCRSGNTNNLQILIVWVHSEANMFADGVFCGEKMFGQSVIDNCDRAMILVIGPAKVAAGYHGNAERSKKSGTNDHLGGCNRVRRIRIVQSGDRVFPGIISA